MTDKEQAIRDLHHGYQQFRRPIAELDDDAFNQVWLGRWGLSQLLAHMAGWYREMTPGFARVVRGERPTPEGVDYSDSDAWNAKFEKLAKPGRAALADFDQAYQDYLAAAKSLPDELYGVDPERGRPKIGNRLLQASGIGHFEEHQEQLDAWLKSRGA